MKDKSHCTTPRFGTICVACFVGIEANSGSLLFEDVYNYRKQSFKHSKNVLTLAMYYHLLVSNISDAGLAGRSIFIYGVKLSRLALSLHA